MEHQAFLDTPSLTFAIAMAAGMIAQGVARHVFLPGIVLLLLVGILLGPDVANVVRPQAMGDALIAVVGFGVAVILFEGGLSLKLRVLRAQAKPIRRLVTIGALITGAGGAVAARAFMGWSWTLSLLFGTLVIVTGPTVITPLVRRIRPKHTLSTILEAEGVFIDAVGATIAVVALEIAIAPSGRALSAGALHVLMRIGTGSAVGVAGGLLLGLMLRYRHVVPEGLNNVLALAWAVLLFEISNGIVPESGIAAAIMAGLVVGNMPSHALDEIVEFKEQLTVLMIATLFVLLAADVRLADVYALGWPGVLTVLVLMFVVRPINVWACTFNTGLHLRDKLFLSWLAPRGIVAAAVASLFAVELGRVGIAGGTAMKALVFLVIAITVTVQGLTGGVVAYLLGVKRTSRSGTLILGANPLAIRLGQLLQSGGQDVLLVDTNADDCHAAEQAGLKVFHANGLEQRTLIRAHADDRTACVAATPNESVNFLFAKKILEDFRGPEIYVALEAKGTGVTEEMLEQHDVRVLFGSERNVQSWIARERNGQVEHARCRFTETSSPRNAGALDEAPERALMPLVGFRDGKAFLVDESTRAKPGDEVEFAVAMRRIDVADKWMRKTGWERLTPAGESAARPGSLAETDSSAADTAAGSAGT